MDPQSKLLIFLYWKPYDQDMFAYARGQVPSHRLTGYVELVEGGFALTYIRCPSQFYQILHRHHHLWMLYSNINAINLLSSRPAEIFATGESTAYLILALKRLGLINCRVYLINVALLKKENLTGLRRQFTTWLLSAADHIISFSSGQIALLEGCFKIPAAKQTFVPFGIDTEFFYSSLLETQRKVAAVPKVDCEEGYLLALGNPGRDYFTLIRAMEHLKDVKLRIYAAERNYIDKEFPNLPANVSVLPGNLPFAVLADVYKRAAIGIVPLIKTDQSCGQTVLLEMMANKLPVVATASTCTEDYIEDGVNAITVPAEDAPALAAKIRFLLDNPEKAKSIADAGYKTVCDRFTIVKCACQIAEIIR